MTEEDFDLWGEEAKQINKIQVSLGPLDEETRRIRIKLGGLVLCDSGVPVCIDELLRIIGSGQLPDASYRVGCWPGGEGITTQPGHCESMRSLEEIIRAYVRGQKESVSLGRFPFAGGFIRRLHQWFGSVDDLSELQRKMIERLLLPFELFKISSHADYEIMMQVSKKCFGEDSEGRQLDRSIAEMADLPEIARYNSGDFSKAIDSIDNPHRKTLYALCGQLAESVYELSDCHHNTFRVIEKLIYGISRLSLEDIPDRTPGAERKRLGQLLYSYTLGLDSWLSGKPLQFLLLDLSHVDFGFDPKNEILRVYSYLGEERDSVKEWLVASLWCIIYRNPHGGLNPLWEYSRNAHFDIVSKTEGLGYSGRSWIDNLK
jgi:hypothetical protein